MIFPMATINNLFIFLISIKIAINTSIYPSTLAHLFTVKKYSPVYVFTPESPGHVKNNVNKGKIANIILIKSTFLFFSIASPLKSILSIDI